MKTEKITLKNETGLHARPASEIVKIASKYQSTISLIANGKTINAKSILKLWQLELNQVQKLKFNVMEQTKNLQ